MSILKITYTDKQQLNANASISAINKCQATDLNEIKNVVNNNADNIGDLATLETTNTDSLVNAVNGLASGEIVDSKIEPASGYIKYSNGFMIQWRLAGGTGGGTAWTEPIFYSDISVGDWEVPFVSLFNCISAVNSSLYWSTCYDYTNTSGGNVRVFRPNNGTTTVWTRVVGYGLWK